MAACYLRREKIFENRDLYTTSLLGGASLLWLADEDPNTFEEFLEPDKYIDLGYLFTTDGIFSSKDELVDWAKQTAMKAKTYLILNRYQRSRTADRRPYVTGLASAEGQLKSIRNQ
ncbi:hypothetical protein M9H77_11287 [Catharanthus roseus]|uniref:Uncharacterized protein n=1 Tax=Catharanthus roseus TaxID=4058 RepID=A0ACC0BE80_CATRO|nr:hypothetical protein M9H77_11287 [Catharanthus roseus]